MLKSQEIAKLNRWVVSYIPFGVELLATGKIHHGSNHGDPRFPVKGFTYFRLHRCSRRTPQRPVALGCLASELGLTAGRLAAKFDLAVHRCGDMILLTRSGHRIRWPR
jgi:hypothetical protein